MPYSKFDILFCTAFECQTFILNGGGEGQEHPFSSPLPWMTLRCTFLLLCSGCRKVCVFDVFDEAF